MTVVCLMKNFTFLILLSPKPFSSQKNNSCTPGVPMFFFVAVVISRERLVVRRHFSSMSQFQSRVASRNLP